MAKLWTFPSILILAVLLCGPAHALRAVELGRDEQLTFVGPDAALHDRTARGFARDVATLSPAVFRGDTVPLRPAVGSMRHRGYGAWTPGAEPSTSQPDLLRAVRLTPASAPAAPGGGVTAAAVIAVCLLVARRRLGAS